MENSYEYNERFRLIGQKFDLLINLLAAFYEEKPTEVELHQKKNIALHWLGRGVQYHSVGDMHGVSEASVYRAIRDVVRNAVMFPEYVK